jgi:ribosomal protein S18 acetylase RimI-like enzyme
MKVREADKSDYDEIFELEQEWFNEGMSPGLENPIKKEFFKEMNKSTVIIAIGKNKIIGYLICKIRKAGEDNYVHKIKKGEEYADLDSLYIKKKFRGKGVGKELVKNCFKKVKEAGYKKVIVSADSKELNKLVKFYMKLGFKPLFTRLMVEFK